jgi:membrane-associated phospholipid phosphatase
VRWKDEWPRFRVWQYGYTLAALTSGLVLRFGVDHGEANWRGGVLFDDAITERAGLEDPATRLFAQRMTDGFFYGAMAYRLVDSVVVPWAGYGDADLALQMSMIDLQSFGTVAIVLWGTQALVRRERPAITLRCESTEDHSELVTCGPSAERNRSFIAGHPAVGMAAAGLTCMHHANIPLYGRTGDTLACGLMLGAAGMNGIGRLMTENHYASDLVLGYALGGFAGFVLPSLLHYGFGSQKPERASSSASAPKLRTILLPRFDGEIGVSAVGTF